MRAVARILTALSLGLTLVATAGCPSQGIPSYDPCTRSRACDAVTDRCVEIVFPAPTGGEGVDSMCTYQGCAADADCPLDPRGVHGVCLGFDLAPTTCFEGCTRLADCATGWTCQEVAAAGEPSVRVCVPAPPG